MNINNYNMHGVVHAVVHGVPKRGERQRIERVRGGAAECEGGAREGGEVLQSWGRCY